GWGGDLNQQAVAVVAIGLQLFSASELQWFSLSSAMVLSLDASNSDKFINIFGLLVLLFVALATGAGLAMDH
ncbi:unnamed protein product, partial [Polarella glacialis]